MPRTTPELVATIIKVKAGADVTPYIDAANELVTEVCTESDYTDVRLEKIERWLAAYFYDVNYPRAEREGVSPGPFTTYEPIKVDLGLNLNKYGQVAMLLDTAGNLAKLNEEIQNGGSRGKASSAWLGTAREY